MSDDLTKEKKQHHVSHDSVRLEITVSPIYSLLDLTWGVYKILGLKGEEKESICFVLLKKKKKRSSSL
jgi:hypothetical protein